MFQKENCSHTHPQTHTHTHTHTHRRTHTHTNIHTHTNTHTHSAVTCHAEETAAIRASLADQSYCGCGGGRWPSLAHEEIVSTVSKMRAKERKKRKRERESVCVCVCVSMRKCVCVCVFAIRKHVCVTEKLTSTRRFRSRFPVCIQRNQFRRIFCIRHNRQRRKRRH